MAAPGPSPMQRSVAMPAAPGMTVPGVVSKLDALRPASVTVRAASIAPRSRAFQVLLDGGSRNAFFTLEKPSQASGSMTALRVELKKHSPKDTVTLLSIQTPLKTH